MKHHHRRTRTARSPRARTELMCALTALLLACLSPAGFADTVNVAVASNFVGTLRALAADFEGSTGHRLALSAGSTGKLYAQILNGAPYDVFLAADSARPASLVAAGHADRAACFTYTVGQLALWTPSAEADPRQMLMEGRIRTLAIANPALVPYGAAAALVLEQTGARSPARIVRGESVGQAMTFVQTRSATAGFVSFAQVLALPAAQRGRWWLPPRDTYSPITQDAVVLRNGAGVEAFAAWLLSENTQRALAERGYLAVPASGNE